MQSLMQLLAIMVLYSQKPRTSPGQIEEANEKTRAQITEILDRNQEKRSKKSMDYSEGFVNPSRVAFIAKEYRAAHT